LKYLEAKKKGVKTMTYEAEITRDNPGCFLFLIDQSGSMADRIGDKKGGKTKAQGVSEAINDFLQNLITKCTGPDGVLDYFHVGAIVYADKVEPGFTGALANRDLVPLSDLTKYLSAGTGTEKNALPLPFGPVGEGTTRMCAALKRAHEVLEDWVQRHPISFPPIVINITDGEATDGNPIEPAHRIASLTTKDGNVLIFNCHISARKATPILFPHDAKALPGYGPRLFQMSSILPPKFRAAAKDLNFDIYDDTRGFAFNAELTDLVRFMDIGKHTLITQMGSAAMATVPLKQSYVPQVEVIQNQNTGREDEIRKIAFSIWEKENRPNGQDLEHWLKAEKIWESEQNKYK
jgi:hypothetical protein